MSGASSNYNAAYASVTLQEWHGLTALSNLTFSRTLGDGGTTQNGITSIDSYHRDTDYRTPSQDIPWVFNVYALYQVPYMSSQHGVAGRVLGGWSVAPLFRAQSVNRVPGARLPEGTCVTDTFGRKLCSQVDSNLASNGIEINPVGR